MEVTMKIELKNVKHFASMSEETECYNATLYIDGAKAGVVSNRGHGGPDDFHGDRALFAQADEWCKANLPRWSMGDETHETDLEMHCGELLNEHLAAKELRRALKSKVLTSRPGGTEVYQSSWKGVKAIEAKHIAAVRKAHPDDIILNELPFEEALKIYRKGAQ
jgi:hypothetical protein